jgi:hypothetical protein
LCRLLHATVPNLDRLNIRSFAVHGVPLPPGYLAAAIAYGVFYAAGIVILACIVFERREFV